MPFFRPSPRQLDARAMPSASALAVSLTLAVFTFGLLFAGLIPPAIAADDPDGVDISIDVLGPSSGSENPRPTTPTTPGTTRPRGGTVTQETIDDPAEADEALGDAPFDLGGVLYVSGLNGIATPVVHPANGAVKLRMTVRNASATTFDSTARFWLENAVGARVAQVSGVTVKGLEPGETRVVTARLASLGQWTLLHGHVTLTPPTSVEGTELVPITRDTIVTLIPLFALSLAGGLLSLGGLLWLARRLVSTRA